MPFTQLEANVCQTVASAAGSMTMVWRCGLNPVLARFERNSFQSLKLKYDELLSSFAFSFNLCHYTMAAGLIGPIPALRMLGIEYPIPTLMLWGRGIRSSTSQLNLSHADTKTHLIHPVILPYTP